MPIPDAGLAPGETGDRLRWTVLVLIAAAWLVLFQLVFYARSVGDAPGYPRLAVLLELPNLLAANFSPSPASGWRYMPQRFDVVGCAALILLAAWGMGRIVLNVLGWHGLQTTEAVSLTFGVGLSAWSLVTLTAGLAGSLSQAGFIALAVLFAISGTVLDWRRRASVDTAASRTSPPAGGRPTALRAFVLAAVTPFLLAMFLGAMLPPTDFDVKEYHLQGPKEYWQAGEVSLLPHNVYTSFPFLTEMLSLSAMVIRGDWHRGALAGKAVLMSYAVVTALAVFSVARRLAGERAAWLAVLAFLTTPWVFRISVIAYAEGALCCYLSLTTLAWLLVCESAAPADARSTRCGVLLTGLLAGSAAATKYPGVVSAVIPFGVAVMWTVHRQSANGRRLRSAVIAAMIYSAGVLATFGPWLLKNLLETGNPVYPLLWSLFGGASFDAATNARWTAAHSPPTHLLSEPSRILPDLWERLQDLSLRSDWQSVLLCGLAPFSLVAARRQRGVRRLWLYVLWLLVTWCWLTHRIDRFWVPMIPLLAVLAGIGAACTWDALRRHASDGPLAALSLHGLLAASVVTAVGFNLAVITTGLAGFNGFLLEESEASRLAVGTAVRLCLEAGVGPRDRVLFVGEAAVFDAPFPNVYNTVFDDSYFERWCADPVQGRPKQEWPLKDAESIRRTFAEQGITHLCVRWSEVVRYRLPGSYGFTDFVHPRRFDELVARGVLERAEFITVWDHPTDSERTEISNWAPELRLSSGDKEVFRDTEVYRVRRE